MKTQKFIGACDAIFNYFISQEEIENDEGKIDLKFFDFLDQLLPGLKRIEDYLINKNYRIGNEHIVDCFNYFQSDLRSCSFALGYIIGQMFDLTCPEAQKNLGVIKKTIREKNLLPYLPRERKAT